MEIKEAYQILSEELIIALLKANVPNEVKIAIDVAIMNLKEKVIEE